MNNFRLIFFVALLFAACTKTPQGGEEEVAQSQQEYENFINQTQIGVVIDGKMVKSFDCEQDQIIYDDNQTLFVISNIDYSQHITLIFGGDIYLNNLLNIDYSSNGIDGIKNGVISVKVAKVDSRNHRYWLWSSNLELGFVVDFSI